MLGKAALTIVLSRNAMKAPRQHSRTSGADGPAAGSSLTTSRVSPVAAGVSAMRASSFRAVLPGG
ncbi:hypothetical protein GCM10027168_32050 [Streptomyces capparidis]